jgi:hypothetical protein
LPGAKNGVAAPNTASNYRHLVNAVVTSTLKLSAADRAAMNLDNKKSFGQIEQQKCASVASATNTKIELHESSGKLESYFKD